jgi:hypothetical protein
VYRCALAGMFALESCLAQDYVAVPGARDVVLFASGLEIGAHDFFESNWMRPLSSWRGWRGVVRCLDGAAARRLWRPLADVALAAGSELWRDRDYLRHNLLHPRGPAATTRALVQEDAGVKRQREGYLNLGKEVDFLPINVRAYEQFLQRLHEENCRIVLLENTINPREATPASRRLDDEMRQLVARLSARIPLHYVPCARQAEPVQPEDWLDVLHVNEAGRVKVTRSIAAAVKESERLADVP